MESRKILTLYNTHLKTFKVLQELIKADSLGIEKKHQIAT